MHTGMGAAPPPTASAPAEGDGGAAEGQIDTGLTQGHMSTGAGVAHDGRALAGSLTGVGWGLLETVLALP